MYQPKQKHRAGVFIYCVARSVLFAKLNVRRMLTFNPRALMPTRFTILDCFCGFISSCATIFRSEKCLQICGTDTSSDLVVHFQVIFSHLRLWIAVARHNLKGLKISIE